MRESEYRRNDKKPQGKFIVRRDETLSAVFGVLIFVALGIGFGKIVGVDSANDRAIQNYRLNQLPRQMEERLAKLRERDLPEDRFNAEAQRVYAALYKDAMKARPTLSANDRSRWATIRALVEKDARVYRFTPVMKESEKEARAQELAADASGEAPEFRYLPSEILVNCEAECPEKFDSSKIQGKRYAKKLVPYAIDKTWETPGWDSIDVVKHGLPDEKWDPSNPASGYLYSSKPPLLPTVMAAPYWVLNRVFGLSLKEKPFLTARILLVIYNLLPLGIAFCCLARIINLLGKSNWSKIFAFAAAIFGFFTLTYVATLNNHVPGFASISIALWAACEILCLQRNGWFRFFCAGFFGAFAVACDLPSLAFAGLLCLALLVKRPVKTIFVAIPSGLVVAAAFFATNYVAHNTFVPAYAHKRDHVALEQTLSAGKENDETLVAAAGLFDDKDWYVYVYYPAGRPRVPSSAIISHWANRTGIDRGEPSKARYAFHSTVGLRGVFSLTPIWLLSLYGIILWILFGFEGSVRDLVVKYECLGGPRYGDDDSDESDDDDLDEYPDYYVERENDPDYDPDYDCEYVDKSERHVRRSKRVSPFRNRQSAFYFRIERDKTEKALKTIRGFARTLAFIAATLTVVFFVFFLTRDQGDRNYGGICCCPRWFFPLAPILIPCMLPALELFKGSKITRAIAYLLLFWSVVSAFYPTWNPWISPWLYQLAVDGGLFQPY